MEQTSTYHSDTVLKQSNDDFKHAVLTFSLGANLFILIAWLLAQLSTEYALQLASLI